MWRQRELFDGTYSFVDLLDAHELLDLRAENERRKQEHLAFLKTLAHGS